MTSGIPTCEGNSALKRLHFLSPTFTKKVKCTSDQYFEDYMEEISAGGGDIDLWQTGSGRQFNAHNEMHHFHSVYAHLDRKALETPYGSHVRNLGWNAGDGSLAYSCGSAVNILQFEQGQPDADNNKEFSTVSHNRALKGHSTEIRCLSFNRVNDVLATGDKTGHVFVWRKHGNEWFHQLGHVNPEGSSVCGLAWSADGDRICVVYDNGTLKIGTLNGDHVSCQQYGINPGYGGIAWSPDSKYILVPTDSGELLSFDTANGDQAKYNFHFVGVTSSKSSQPRQIVAARWFHGIQAVIVNLPTLAVLFKHNELYFLKGMDDKHPKLLKTNLLATCGDWSPDGNYFAAAGEFIPPKPKPSSEPLKISVIRMNKVVLFSAAGNFLHDIQMPGNGIREPCSTLAWDPQQLAIGAGSKIYFANICPRYKFTFYAQRILVYTFGKGESVTYLAFWDQEKFSTHRIPGFIVDMKGNDELCAVLVCSRKGIYTVFLVNDQRLLIDTINIFSIQPFALVLTDSAVCSIGSSAVHIWKYKNKQFSSTAEIGLIVPEYLKNEKVIHFDDSSSSCSARDLHTRKSAKELEILEFLSKPTQDPAICADGVNLILAIVRASGKLLLYSLPFGELITSIETLYQWKLKPSRIFINSDGTEIAKLDNSGILCTYNVKNDTIKIIDKRDVLDVKWTKDNPNQLCIMDRTNIYVLENGEIRDTIRLASPACFVQVRDYQITTISMNELMSSQKQSKLPVVRALDMKVLRDLKYLIARNTPAPTIRVYAERNDHLLLWTVLGQYAIHNLDFEVAEMALVKCKDYAGLQLLKKLKGEPEKLLQRAYIANYYEDFSQARELYLEAGRSDLVVRMLTETGKWDELEMFYDSLPPHQQPTFAARSLVTEMCDIEAGDHAFEKLEIENAMVYYGHGRDIDRVIACAIILEDYDILEDMRASFPDDQNVLRRIKEYMEAFEDEKEEVIN